MTDLDVCAPDGSPVAVFATFPPGNAPAYIDARLARGSTILDLGCGAGRLARPLAAAGHEVIGVDLSPEMIDRFVVQIVADSATICTTKAREGAALAAPAGVVADIDGLDLGRTFDAVILASYLVNDPDAERAHRFLATCRRHLSATGRAFIQRHHPEFLAESAAIESAESGYGFRYEPLARSGSIVTARMTYVHDDHHWHQELHAMILDDDAFFELLERAGLRFDRWLDEFDTWAEVTPA